MFGKNRPNQGPNLETLNFEPLGSYFVYQNRTIRIHQNPPKIPKFKLTNSNWVQPNTKYKTYISVVSAGKWLGICVNFLFRQSAIPSEHLQGVGQVHDAEGKHSEVSISSSLPKTHTKKNSHKIFLHSGEF